MPRFDFYRSPETAPPRSRSRSVVWAMLCIALELSALFWLWVVLNP
ncbi:MAG TPA: hypothetical protein VGL30_13145 [Phenylobacterium sp.]|jgi:hypothetical protein